MIVSSSCEQFDFLLVLTVIRTRYRVYIPIFKCGELSLLSSLYTFCIVIVSFTFMFIECTLQ